MCSVAGVLLLGGVGCGASVGVGRGSPADTEQPTPEAEQTRSRGTARARQQRGRGCTRSSVRRGCARSRRTPEAEQTRHSAQDNCVGRGCGLCVMLAAQIPPDADIAAQLPADGDYVLYRACAAHLAQDASLLSAESTDEDAVIASLRGSMRALREAGAAEPPPLDGPLSEAIMTSLVEDVESRGGGLFRRLEDQPDVKDVLLDVFNEERLEHQRGWRGLAADGDGGAAAMDDATAAAATAAKEAAAEGRSFRVAIIGGGASGLTAAIKLKQAGIDFVVLERNSSVGGVWWQNSYPDGK